MPALSDHRQARLTTRQFDESCIRPGILATTLRFMFKAKDAFDSAMVLDFIALQETLPPACVVSVVKFARRLLPGVAEAW
jgi:hypothetical protein